MGLLEIPAELRLKIYEYIPDLSYGGLRHEVIGPNVRLTPPISRVCHILREEVLPLYAKTSFFIIQTDDNKRVQVWLQALGDHAVSKVENLQLSRHWQLTQPTRWQGHVGFYIRLQLIDSRWSCTTGTYPIANDIRGMRLESVNLLRHIVTQRLRTMSVKQPPPLTRSYVEFVVNAMEILASHPISTFDTEQSEVGRKRRRNVWSNMERNLFDLQTQAGDEQSCAEEPVVFYTPY